MYYLPKSTLVWITLLQWKKLTDTIHIKSMNIVDERVFINPLDHTIVWSKIWACNTYHYACRTEGTFLQDFEEMLPRFWSSAPLFVWVFLFFFTNCFQRCFLKTKLCVVWWKIVTSNIFYELFKFSPPSP